MCGREGHSVVVHVQCKGNVIIRLTVVSLSSFHPCSSLFLLQSPLPFPFLPPTLLIPPSPLPPTLPPSTISSPSHPPSYYHLPSLSPSLVPPSPLPPSLLPPSSPPSISPHLLILLPSFSRSPRAPDLATLSLPARSTKLILETFSVPVYVCVYVHVCVYADVCVYVHVCVRERVCICTCVCV